jgi:hypothetical protein
MATRVLGSLALVGLVVCLFALVADAASGPSQYVPARSGGWPGWLAGPLSGVGSGLSSGLFQGLMLAICGCYLLVLATARALPGWTIAAAVLVAHAVLLLGPPLISQDVFGYLAYARMGAEHGLDPYTHFAAEASADPVFGFLGWPFQHSPYGPLFTLASYGAAPLSLAGGLWAMKSVAVISSLAAVWLSARAAASLGRSASATAAFVGLNPVLLVLAVGGAHNDTLLIMFLAMALALTAGRASGPRAGAVALVGGVGVKITAGLLLPFLVLSRRDWRQRLRLAASALVALLALLAIGVAGFGVHALGFLGAVGEQQQLVATHSIPAETARLFGLDGTPGWWRDLFRGGFAIVLAGALWRTARGADWREAAAWSTLALLAATAWLLPWYAIWVLPLAGISGDRRLRVAVLLTCAYAVLIHLPLADPLLSPHHVHRRVELAPGTPGIPRLSDRLEFAGLEVLRDVRLDFRF